MARYRTLMSGVCFTALAIFWTNCSYPQVEFYTDSGLPLDNSDSIDSDSHGDSVVTPDGNGSDTMLDTIQTPQPIQLSLGYRNSCALWSDGLIKCWGLIIGNNGSPSLAPTTVTGITRAVRVAINRAHGCAVLTDQTVWCWGANTQGNLGDGTTDPRSFPVQVLQTTNPMSALGMATDITVGAAHSCAVLQDGTVRCWGNNSQSQLGNASMANSSLPVIVTNASGIGSITASSLATCVHTQNGMVQCWGANSSGQLGTGDTTPHSTAVSVRGLAGIMQISAGSTHVCAVSTSGVVQCWGDNTNGKIGNGMIGGSVLMPTLVSNLTNVSRVAAGGIHTCALRVDGTVYCWGDNTAGSLGNSSELTSPTPVRVFNLDRVTNISAGDAHTCAIREDHSIWCWGSNYNGELGAGTSGGFVSVPVLVAQ